MDDTDGEILSILRTHGRETFSAIGREIGLSTNAVAARVRRMETAGVITGYTVLLADQQPEPSARIEAFIDVRLHADRDSEEFLTWVRTLAGVRDAVHVTGPYDYLLRVAVPDMAALESILRALKPGGGAIQTQTRMALR
ncbi:MAG TPA: Lrp/AsnC family transcriptional regulator [Microbacterium sp.]|nr:Lrp/AsnC family transcriptional regulator [Microbacterium sp.]